MSDERAHEALDHFQAAALELIAALRAVLDLAEEAVREPQALGDIIASTARAAAEAAASFAPAAHGASTHDVGHTGPHEGGVEHIKIS
jgi:hypothetical protein